MTFGADFIDGLKYCLIGCLLSQGNPSQTHTTRNPRLEPNFTFRQYALPVRQLCPDLLSIYATVISDLARGYISNNQLYGKH